MRVGTRFCRKAAAEQSVALDRAGMAVVRSITFLALARQVNAVVMQRGIFNARAKMTIKNQT
jgi:hypothetical protein